MKRYIMSLLLVWGIAMNIVAIDATKVVLMKTANLEYQSIDAHNRPITLSMHIAYCSSSLFNSSPGTMKFIVLNNHYTICADSECPTKSPSQDMTFMDYMATENALVVTPDYQGYGASVDRTHPYLEEMLQARQQLDGLLAAMDYIRQKGGSFASDYYTLNVGYSQGGAVTIAVQKYLETIAPDDLVEVVRLRQSCSGAPPLIPMKMLTTWKSSNNITYPGGVILCAEGMLEGNSEGCMHGFTEKDIYSTKFLQSGILEAVRAKQTNMDGIMDMFKEKLGVSKVTFNDIVNTTVQRTSSPIYRALAKALGKNNLITGWTPQAPITFFHETNDNVVPYFNTDEARKAWPGVKYVSLEELKQMELSSILQTVMGQTEPSNTHGGYAVYFYIYYLNGSIR